MKVAFANGVHRMRLRPEEVPGAVRESTTAFREHDVPALWWLSPLTRPRDVARELESNGWGFDEAMPWMAASIDRLSWPPAVRGLEIVRVTGESTHQAWLAGMTAGFSMRGSEQLAMTSLAAAVGYGEDARWVRWAGFLEGRPVASSGLMVGGGVAGIYNVATAPDVRRRGIGAAMTAAAVAQGRDRGYEVVVLGASELGSGVYRRMGFAEVCRNRVYLLPERSGNTATGDSRS
ncbi:MAG: GNAT family N-acetyltransferase [Actinomycetota bacterium]